MHADTELAAGGSAAAASRLFLRAAPLHSDSFASPRRISEAQWTVVCLSDDRLLHEASLRNAR
jgi:hypothetical protein